MDRLTDEELDQLERLVLPGREMARLSRLIAEVREWRAHVCDRIWYARGEDGLIYKVEMVRPTDPYTRIRWHVVNQDGEHQRWLDEAREVTLLQPDERLEQLRIPTAIRQNAPQRPQERAGGSE